MSRHEQRVGPWVGFDLHRRRRVWPLRRLSRQECDIAGYAAPLVLSELQMRWVLGPWRRTRWFVIEQHPRGIVWQGSKAELEQLGIHLEASP